MQIKITKPIIARNKETGKYLRLDSGDDMCVSEVDEPKMATPFFPEYDMTEEEIIEAFVRGDWNETYTDFQEDYEERIRERIELLPVKVTVEIIE